MGESGREQHDLQFQCFIRRKKYCINKVSMAFTLWGWSFLRMIIYPETNGEKHPCLKLLLRAASSCGPRGSVSSWLHLSKHQLLLCASQLDVSPKVFCIPDTLLDCLISISIVFLNICSPGISRHPNLCPTKGRCTPPASFPSAK